MFAWKVSGVVQLAASARCQRVIQHSMEMRPALRFSKILTNRRWGRRIPVVRVDLESGDGSRKGTVVISMRMNIEMYSREANET